MIDIRSTDKAQDFEFRVIKVIFGDGSISYVAQLQHKKDGKWYDLSGRLHKTKDEANQELNSFLDGLTVSEEVVQEGVISDKDSGHT